MEFYSNYYSGKPAYLDIYEEDGGISIDNYETTNAVGALNFMLNNKRAAEVYDILAPLVDCEDCTDFNDYYDEAIDKVEKILWDEDAVIDTYIFETEDEHPLSRRPISREQEVTVYINDECGRDTAEQVFDLIGYLVFNRTFYDWLLHQFRTETPDVVSYMKRFKML